MNYLYKPGDQVRVIRRPKDGEYGAQTAWGSERLINQIVVIHGVATLFKNKQVYHVYLLGNDEDRHVVPETILENDPGIFVE